jgi:hypothetical protein
MKFDDLPAEIGHEVQRALRPMMNPLLEAIQALNRSMKEHASPVQLSQGEIETMLQSLRSTTTATTESVGPIPKKRNAGKPSHLT